MSKSKARRCLTEGCRVLTMNEHCDVHRPVLPAPESEQPPEQPDAARARIAELREGLDRLKQHSESIGIQPIFSDGRNHE